MRIKILSLFTLLLFCSASFAQEGSVWKWSHQQPQGNTLRWVKMWDNNNWYAVGYAGTFMKTTNAGATWTFNHMSGLYDPASGTYESIYDAHFFDMNNGVVCGGGGMVSKTTDGGATWTGQVVGSTAVTWYQTYFVNATTGFVAGTTSGRLAMTTDGGTTWTVNTIIPSGTYYDVYSPDGTTILVASSSGNIRRSTDAGATWTLISTGASNTLYVIQFMDANNGWVAGSSGTARYTTDGGLTWTTATATGASIIYDLDFHNGAVYVTGDSFSMYKSTDNGTTWTAVEFLAPVAQQPWTSTYYATSFLGDNFVTVGGNGLINSVFGAATPTAHTYYVKAGTIYDVWAESSTGRVIAVGDNGTTGVYDQLIYSTNGGQTWNIGITTDAPSVNGVQYTAPAFEATEDEPVETDLIPNTEAIFRAVDMINPNLGYAVGQFGAVYRTSNGGLGWDSITTTIGNVYLYDVDFIDASNGWVVGASGNCWKTTDAGATWTQQTTTLTGIIYSISMASATHGWLGGASGTVNATTDGGATWSLQTSGLGTSIVYAIDAIDVNTAYACASSSKVIKTTDGGTTWTLFANMPAELGTATTLYTISFRDEMHGVVGGSSGRTAMTHDGGATWQYANTAGSTIYGISVAQAGLDTTSVYAVGSLGYIHKLSGFVVPVELTSFTSSVIGNVVTLNWTTATEKNNSGFAVERSSEAGVFEQIGFVQGNGTTTRISSYSYSDNVQTGSYVYRLKQIDYDGSFSYSNEILVDVSVPEVFALEQNYPNPFNPATVIRYSIPQDGMVTLSIYNVLGQEIGTLVNQVQKAGRYEVNFDASAYSSGVYFYKIEAGNFSSIKKMMLTK